MPERESLSGDLFPSLALPTAHDGELLYSWCARFHRLSGNIHPRETSRQLFGHFSSGLRHDFPTPLGYFHTNTGAHIGTLEDLLLRRTLFGFYRPFLSPARAAALKLAIETGGYGKVHAALGLAASLPSFTGRLKACPECVREDRDNRPTSGWRTEHQWPAMLICRRHRQPLSYVAESFTEQSTRQWILPDDIEGRGEWHRLPELTVAIHDRLAELSEWCHSIVARPDLRLDTARLRYCYLVQAMERGYVAMDGSVRLGHLRDDFVEWIGQSAHWPGLSFVGEIQDANAGFLGQLLRRYPGIRHPLKHIVMMAYLFPTAEAFLARYKEVSEIYDTDGERGITLQLTNLRSDLARLVVDEKRSVSSAAAALGVPVGQATRFLSKCSAPYVRRPRIVGTEKERALEQALRTGKDRADICQELGIRNGFIKDYLATRPELRATWESMRAARLKHGYREHFLKAMAENPTLPIKAIRRLPRNGFQWLYNNDKDWLVQILPALWRKS